ncbi:general substrate transporter [Stachybotrys elegans]|uniref:General substrate transporter n=1 Tax=Stachybotrys elegans TaxID=80388 RepID=A0A8K0SJP9_9HYPO|nr:general substrate transporter [Stachybotrys elegans]
MPSSLEKTDGNKTAVDVTHEYVELELEGTRLADVAPDYGRPWWRVPHLLRLNLLLTVPLLTPYIMGYDGSMFNGMQSMEAWQDQFGHPTGAKLGVLATMQTIGNIVSAPIATYATDRYGRRWPIIGGCVLCIVGGVLQSIAGSVCMLIISRAIVGVGSGFTCTAAPPLIAELSYPTQRAIVTAILTTFWYLGSLVAAWSAYASYHIDSGWCWRILPLIQIVPCVIQLALMFLVPESPRWLIANGQDAQAEKDLALLHGGSIQPTELVQFELREIRQAIQNEASQQTSSYMHFMTTPGNRYRLFIATTLGLLVQWCGNGVGTYYLTPVLAGIGMKSVGTQNLISSVLQTSNYAVAMFSSMLMNRVGRRPLLLVSLIGMTLGLITWTVLSAVNESQGGSNNGVGIGIVIVIFLYFVFYNVALNPVPMTYLLEVLPFTLRAKGVTIYSQVQNLSSVFLGFVNPIALDAIAWKYYIVFIVITVGFLFLIWRFYPETKGRSLEEVGQIFDGIAAKDVSDLERRSSGGTDTTK